jgi:Bacterial Ig-like domain (group 3)/FG-GAP-like repeat
MCCLLYRSALLFAFAALPGLASGQTGTGSAATALAASPTTITVGGSVGLDATVQPSDVVINPGQPFVRPTGSITFLDGSTPLSTTPVALSPTPIASAAFQQVFGTPDSAITQSNEQGELTGDLNGDGVPDILIYALTVNNPVSIQTFVSNGKGGYTAGTLQALSFTPTNSPSNTGPIVPVLIDVNGDGKLDLLDGIQVAYGNGDGTFAQATSVSFLSSGFVTSYAADLNGDGKTDILAVNTLPPPNTNTNPPSVQWAVTVFLNGGGGTFTSVGTFPTAAPFPGDYGYAGFFPPVFVDLNGDGKLDLVTQNQYVPMTNVGVDPDVEVLLNNGDGTFGSFTPLTVPNPPNNSGTYEYYETGSGDFNGDGKQDLVLALTGFESDNTDAIIFLGNGDGTFQTPTFFALTACNLCGYTPPPNFTVQDVNLDGKLDLAFGDGQLALGNGNGTFTLGTPLFPLQGTSFYPLIPMTLAGNPVPSLVYLLLPATPPPAAVFTPQTSSSAALSLSTLAVGAHTISARYSGDVNYASDTSAGVTVTVNQAVSATAVKSSANPAFAGQSVTLTANVTSNGPMPTGNVTFTSGSTSLGTVSLSGGSAAYTTSFNTAGTQTISASYSGDANNQASSATISQTVNAAFNLQPSGANTLTVQSGQAVNTTINVTGASGFSGQVAFACSGLPADAVCTFNPSSVAVSGSTVVPTSLTVNTAATTTAALRKQDTGNDPRKLTCSLGLSSLILLWSVRRRSASLRAMLSCLLLMITLGLTACGGGGNGSGDPSGTAPGTYNFTVTATSGNAQTTSAYTLVVQ